MDDSEMPLGNVAQLTPDEIDSRAKTYAQQTRRLDEYRCNELDDTDALHATLAAQAAGNFEMAQRLVRELLEAADETGSLADVLAEEPKMLPAVLQLQRQADRFINLSAERQRASDTEK